MCSAMWTFLLQTSEHSTLLASKEKEVSEVRENEGKREGGIMRERERDGE